MDFVVDLEEKLTDLDFTRKHAIIEIVESYKKHKPSLDFTDQPLSKKLNNL